MARMRSLKPEYWLDRKLARTLTRDERMLYLGLWNQADEWGRANGDARVIKGQIFPFDDDLGLPEIEGMLKALEAVGVVQMYEHENDPFLFLPKLAKHQRLEPHKVPSRFPEPPPVGVHQPDTASDLHVHAAPTPDPGPAQTAPERDPDPTQTGSERDPGAIRAKHVAGSREHVAGVHGPDESAPDHPTDPKPPNRRKPKRSLPDDFTITDEMRSWHRTKGLADVDVDRESERFRRDALAQDRRYADWSQAWRNWIDRAAQWGHIRARPLASVADGGGSAPSLTLAEVADILGVDSWQVPAPPPDLDTDDHGRYSAWCQQQTEAHRAERVQQALVVLERRLVST